MCHTLLKAHQKAMSTRSTQPGPPTHAGGTSGAIPPQVLSPALFPFSYTSLYLSRHTRTLSFSFPLNFKIIIACLLPKTQL